MTRIHVLQLIDGLKIGGAEVLLRDLTAGLQNDPRFRVSVGYSTPGPLVEEVEALGVPVTHLPRAARVDPLLFGRMLALMRADRPHVVHTHLFKSDFHGRAAARLLGVPAVVSTLHNLDDWANKPALARTYGATVRFADRLIAVSDEVREFYIKRVHIPEHKLQTILNGVPIAKFSGQAAAGQALRAELGIPADAPLVGVVGRLAPQKDHVTFLHAARQILSSLPTTRFLIVGTGDLREQLVALAAELGLANAVVFAGIRKDVPSVLAALDVQVFSSRWEGLPVALLEGMAAGKPVVSTAVGGVPSVLIDGETGLLVEPGDARQLATECLRLLQNPVLRQGMGQAARQRAEARYSIDAMVLATAAVYEDVLRRRLLHSNRPAPAEGEGAGG
jgi:glycosyltransferase involved in cell wall biosynthesis